MTEGISGRDRVTFVIDVQSCWLSKKMAHSILHLLRTQYPPHPFVNLPNRAVRVHYAGAFSVGVNVEGGLGRLSDDRGFTIGGWVDRYELKDKRRSLGDTSVSMEGRLHSIIIVQRRGSGPSTSIPTSVISTTSTPSRMGNLTSPLDPLDSSRYQTVTEYRLPNTKR